MKNKRTVPKKSEFSKNFAEKMVKIGDTIPELKGRSWAQKTLNYIGWLIDHSKRPEEIWFSKAHISTAKNVTKSNVILVVNKLKEHGFLVTARSANPRARMSEHYRVNYEKILEIAPDPKSLEQAIDELKRSLYKHMVVYKSFKDDQELQRTYQLNGIESVAVAFSRGEIDLDTFRTLTGEILDWAKPRESAPQPTETAMPEVTDETDDFDPDVLDSLVSDVRMNRKPEAVNRTVETPATVKPPVVPVPVTATATVVENVEPTAVVPPVQQPPSVKLPVADISVDWHSLLGWNLRAIEKIEDLKQAEHQLELFQKSLKQVLDIGGISEDAYQHYLDLAERLAQEKRKTARPHPDPLETAPKSGQLEA